MCTICFRFRRRDRDEGEVPFIVLQRTVVDGWLPSISPRIEMRSTQVNTFARDRPQFYESTRLG